MATIAQLEPGQIVGGVDTHKHVHVVAALSHIGRVLDVESFPATHAGYRQLLRWLRRHGEVAAVGVEGCGSWGAGIARHLTAEGLTVIEVNRPNRQNRQRRGKSDPVDAEAAGRAVLNGDATVTPKTGVGPVEALRQLRVARAGAMKARIAAANQLHSLCDTAPESVRAQLRPLTLKQKIATAASWRPRGGVSVEATSKRALACVARRWRTLAEAKALQADIQLIVDELAPRLLDHHGVGYETASQLLVAAGDNPDRLGHERSFAAAAPHRSPRRPARPTATASTAAVTAKPTPRSGPSSASAWPATHPPRPTSNDAPPTGPPNARSCAA